MLTPERFGEHLLNSKGTHRERFSAVVLLAAERAGRLVEDVPSARFRSLRSYHSEWFLACTAGDPVAKTVDLPSILGWVGLVNDDRASLERDVQAVQAMEAEVARVR